MITQVVKRIKFVLLDEKRCQKKSVWENLTSFGENFVAVNVIGRRVCYQVRQFFYRQKI